MFPNDEKIIIIGCCLYGIGLSIWTLNQVRTESDGDQASKMTKLVVGVIPLVYALVAGVSIATKTRNTRTHGTQMSARPKATQSFGTQMSRSGSLNSLDQDYNDIIANSR